MKAVVLAGCPAATLVDVSHSIPAFDVRAGAFVTWAGTRHFQPGTVHLAVVDPGVGTARRRLALAVDGSFYVGPDNGLFDLVLQHGELGDAIELEPSPSAAATFEGRDVFAPAAARLAAGTELRRLGPRVSPAVIEDRGPSVLWVDNFGNLVTSLRELVAELSINGRHVKERARTYGEAPPNRPFLYIGSMGYLEVGLAEARADQFFDAGPGTPIDVH
jgi:S-adenosylmethionine hydrolase